MKINDLPDKEFKIAVIKMLTEDGRMHERSNDFNKKSETIRRYQIEVGIEYNICAEKYNKGVQQQTTLREGSLNIKDRAVELIQSEQQ